MTDIISLAKSYPILDLVKESGFIPNSQLKISSIYKQEKTPSLQLYPDTNSYRCYATGQSGDVINFYMDVYRVDFSTAVIELSINLRAFQSNSPKRTIRKLHSSPKLETKMLKSEAEMFDEWAGKYEYDGGLSRWDAEQLAKSDLANYRTSIRNEVYKKLFEQFHLSDAAFEYLRSSARNLNEETIRQFKLFSLNNFTEALLLDTFTQQQLIISGLFKLDGNFIFRNHRLIIPYIENGIITYIRARYLETELSYKPNFHFPKYLSPINHFGSLSSKRFFNIDSVTHPYSNQIFITEGEFDTMILEQKGFNAVGIPGTSNFPLEALHLFNGKEVFIAFDNDEAGQIAAKNLASAFTGNVHIIKPKGGKDLSEVLR